MNRLDIPNLRVINLFMGARTDGPLAPDLHDLQELTKAYKPATCARHVYLFSAKTAPDETVHKHVRKLKARVVTCELLSGSCAYKFLLEWVLGLRSKKLKYNDRFVRGQFTARWREYQAQQEKAVTQLILPIFEALCQDATRIRSGLEQGSYVVATQAKLYLRQMREVVAACVQARELGLIPQYDDLQGSKDTLLQEHIENQLEFLHESLNTMQELAESSGNDVLKPGAISKEQRARLARLNKSVGLAYQKRQLLRRIDHNGL